MISPHPIALSIRQPWAWAILDCGKDVENRTWPTRFRGPVLIHAAQKLDDMGAFAIRDLLGWPPIQIVAGGHHQRGGIVGVMEIVDCVTASDSAWFTGPRGFVIRNARPLPFLPCKGRLGFFDPGLGPWSAYGVVPL